MNIRKLKSFLIKLLVFAIIFCIVCYLAHKSGKRYAQQMKEEKKTESLED